MLNQWVSYPFAENDVDTEMTIRQALFLGPGFVGGRERLAGALALLGKYDEAPKEFELAENGMVKGVFSIFSSGRGPKKKGRVSRPGPSTIALSPNQSCGSSQPVNISL